MSCIHIYFVSISWQKPLYTYELAYCHASVCAYSSLVILFAVRLSLHGHIDPEPPMYEDEPKLLFNYTISGCVGILATMILVSQVFCMMFFFPTLLFYLLELSLCFSMVFVLSFGVRERKLGFISAYSMYLCFFITWACFCLIWNIWAFSYVSSHPCYMDKDGKKECVKITGAMITALVLSICSTTISMLLSIVQIRFCFLLYKFIRQQRANNHHVTYQHRPTNSPPQYQNSETAPWPEKPPGYAEAATHTPPVYNDASTSQSPEAAILEVSTQNASSSSEAQSSSQNADLVTPPAVFDSFIGSETEVFGETPRNSVTEAVVVVPAEQSVQPQELSETNPFREDVVTRTG